MSDSPRYAAPPAHADEVVKAMGEFERLKVLVVGDLFLDEYIEGECYEISKEGPIPVIRRESTRQVAGAAGNLASSMRNLGATVSVVGLVGKDSHGRVLLSQLRRNRIATRGVLVREEIPTWTYTKIRAHVENTPSRELLRMDILPDGPMTAQMEKDVLASIRREAKGVDGVIVLDQIHHVITEKILVEIPGVARRYKARLHGSSRDHIGSFHDFDLVTPNDREARGAVSEVHSSKDIIEVGRVLRRAGRHQKLFLTLGADGVAVLSPGRSVKRLPSLARKVVDVTGAGDALSSVALLGNILGWDPITLAWTASQAAAIAVEHVGTHHVTRAELAVRVKEARQKGR